MSRKISCLVIVFIFLSVFFISCSGPSNNDGMKALHEYCGGYAEVVKFTEINAIEREYQYNMEFTAHVKIIQDVLAYNDLSGIKSATEKEISESFGYDGYFRKKSFPKGNLYTVKGTIKFEKTKKGWRPAGKSQFEVSKI